MVRPSHIPFWFKPVSNFGLLKLTMFSQQFTYIVHTQLALAPHHLLLAVSTSPHGLAYGKPVGTFPGSFTQMDYSSRMCRRALSAE